VLVRTLGLALIIVGLASLVSLAAPSLAGTGYKTVYNIGVNVVAVDSGGVYLIGSICSLHLPISESYKTMISVDLGGYIGTPYSITLLDKREVKVHLYLHPLLSSAACTLNPPPYTVRIGSISDLDRLIHYTYMTPRSTLTIHNLSLGERADITWYLVSLPASPRAGVLRAIVAVYLPADSFNLIYIANGSTITGRAVVNALSALASSSQPCRSQYFSLLQGVRQTVIEVKVELVPKVTWLAVARGASIVAGGFLVLVVDAYKHPEYYTGKRWRLVRRMAEKLGR
jgi:hypothetical protein